MSSRVATLTASLFLLSCSSSPVRPLMDAPPDASGVVNGGIVEASPAERYQAKPGRHYEQPEAFPDNPLPLYPAELLKRELGPITIQVRIVVSEEGVVTNVVPIEQSTTELMALFYSVEQTIRRWKFSQLVEVVDGPDITTVRDGAGSEVMYQGKARSLPFHQDYRFVFSQSGGVSKVSGQPVAPPPR